MLSLCNSVICRTIIVCKYFPIEITLLCIVVSFSHTTVTRSVQIVDTGIKEGLHPMPPLSSVNKWRKLEVPSPIKTSLSHTTHCFYGNRKNHTSVKLHLPPNLARVRFHVLER